jgi:hypothetical protein
MNEFSFSHHLVKKNVAKEGYIQPYSTGLLVKSRTPCWAVLYEQGQLELHHERDLEPFLALTIPLSQVSFDSSFKTFTITPYNLVFEKNIFTFSIVDRSRTDEWGVALSIIAESNKLLEDSTINLEFSSPSHVSTPHTVKTGYIRKKGDFTLHSQTLLYLFFSSI